MDAFVDASETNITKVIVGLGNPGRKYEATRHNVGFRVIEKLRAKLQLDQGRQAFGGQVIDARLAGSEGRTMRVLMMMPHTFMNRSGQAVRELTGFYKVAQKDVLIVLDDMALPLGQLRFRASGSAGGHNGLNDVLAVFGDDKVQRLRIGIDRPPDYMDAVDFVLTKFDKFEQETIDIAVSQAAEAAEDWVFNGIACAMDKYNRKAKGREPEEDGNSV